MDLLSRINKRLLDFEFDGTVELSNLDSIFISGTFSREDLKQILIIIDEEEKYIALNS